MAWDLVVGETGSRTEIQGRHGGSHSRGISAPAGVGGRDIMLWWQPQHGATFGYVDGWSSDGETFYFTGTGQTGDQRFEHPLAENGRVRDHVANGDQVRLLRYEGTNLVRYLGELRLDGWGWMDDDSTIPPRRVIQFRFRPVGEIHRDASDVVREPVVPTAITEPIAAVPAPRPTALEKLTSDTISRVVQVQSHTARRLELIMVHDFGRWLRQWRDIRATGLRIPYLPEHRNLRADLFLPDYNVVIEAKAGAAREYIRMAIGQLLDYRRYVTPQPGLCVLTPSRPADDMLELLVELGIDAAWRDRDGFDGTASWLAT